MKTLLTMLCALALWLPSPAHAITFFQGVGYELTGAYTSEDKTSAHFTLTITGINGASDLEGGRYGVNAYAFSLPNGFLTASSPGFTLEVGGLNSTGCNGSGNFFCFNDDAPKPNSVLAANSALQFTFDLFLLTGFNLDSYDSHFKIDWLGLKNNYDLISQQLSITGGVTPLSQVPIPPALLLFASGLAGLGALSWRRRKKMAAA